MVRSQLEATEGIEITTTGDGFIAVFDRPTSAVECATRVIGAADSVGLGIRAAVHTGECHVDGESVSGIAVHIAARISELADGGEVLVSQTVHDLVSGSGFDFVRHGRHSLRGVPGRWTLWTLRAGSPAERAAAPTPVRDRTERAQPRRSGGAVRVLIVDDHPLWRETLAGILRQAKITVVGEADTAATATDIAVAKRPDVVVMDFELAESNGVEATERIRAELGDTRVLFLSASDERNNVVRAIRAGANGYLVKTSRSAEVVEGVRRVHRGELVLPPAVAGHVLDELRDVPPPASADPARSLAGLTSRELDILALMAEGRSNQAISETLRLTSKTVEGHVSNIFTKLGLLPEPENHRRVLAVLAYVRAQESS
jgi:DNA-binding NarL/FixJ family response regulator